MAVVVEGFRASLRERVGPLEVIPLPGATLGRDIPQLLTDLLRDQGFVTEVAHATWMASTASRRPVTLVKLEGPASDAVAAGLLFRHIVEQACHALVLVYGGEARLVGSFLEYMDEDGEWTPLSYEAGAEAWPVSQLQRLSPDGYILPDLQLGLVATSLAARPVVALWCGLFSGIASEPRWDIRILRLWVLLDTIAHEVVSLEARVLAPDGKELRIPSGKVGEIGRVARGKDPQGRVYLLLRPAHEALGIPQEVAVTHPDQTLWDEVCVWYEIRNAVAHEGAWLAPPHPTCRPEHRRRTVAAATRAARGGQLDEGLGRYADHLLANVEAVLRAAVDGRFDDLLHPQRVEPSEE
ncbi:MAG: hypothetical protein M3Y48_25160 [Actinomycetota bacterium]|nr:hypothetical protein [Actinomycetota bacterium]